MKHVSYLELDSSLPKDQQSPPHQRIQSAGAQESVSTHERITPLSTTRVSLSLGVNGDVQTTVRGVDKTPRKGIESLEKYMQYTLGQASDFSFEEIPGSQTSTLKVVYRYLGNDAGSIKAPILSLEFEIPKGEAKLKNALMASLKRVLPTSESVMTPQNKAVVQQFSERYDESVPALHETITRQTSDFLRGISSTISSSYKEVLKSAQAGLQTHFKHIPQEEPTQKVSVEPAQPQRPQVEYTKEPITLHVQAKEVVAEPVREVPLEQKQQAEAPLGQERPVPQMTAQMEEFSSIVTSVENAVHKEEVPTIHNISGLGNSFMKYLVQASKSFFVRKGADRASLSTAVDPIRKKLQPWVSKTRDPEQHFMRSLVSRVARIFTRAAKRGQEAHQAAVAAESPQRLSVFSRAKAQFFRLLDSVTLNNQAPLKNPPVSEATRFERVARTQTSAAYINGKSTGTYSPAQKNPSQVEDAAKISKSSSRGVQRSNFDNRKGGQSQETPSTPWQKLSRWTKSLFVAR